MFKVGNIELKDPLLLAPMEDVTGIAFRKLCKELGADIVYTEFVNSDGLIRDNKKTHDKLRITNEERPVGIQIYGGEIDPMREAAIIAEKEIPEIIDINAGCWVKKVANRGAGAGLLKDPVYMQKMVKEIVEAVKLPVTVKTRLGWDENTYPFGDSRNDVTGLFQSSDPVKFILQKNLESTPGSRFHYNSGYTNVLADLVRIQNGINLRQYAEQKLFGPLGITSYRLDMLTSRLAFASGGLYLGVRDLAKIGQLYLNDGLWNGNRIVSKGWITESTQSYINPNYGFANGYGYQWWLDDFYYNGKTFNFYFAAGWGGQYMYLLPQENMIIVITCGYFLTQETVSAQELIADYILPSIN